MRGGERACILDLENCVGKKHHDAASSIEIENMKGQERPANDPGFRVLLFCWVLKSGLGYGMFNL